MIDGDTGNIIKGHRSQEKRPPASLVKKMTLYLVFDALCEKKIQLNTLIKISKKAARQEPSKLGLQPGQTITVKNAILALVTRSANDIAVAVSEHLGESEKKFVKKMNIKAKKLGMKNTVFQNASGLPHPKQVTTAKDMAILSKALFSYHKEYYKYFKTKVFEYKKQRIANHNHMLGVVKGLDGIKTGYTRASKFNISVSVERKLKNGLRKRIYLVVMGGGSSRSRDNKATQLIEETYKKFNGLKISSNKKNITAKPTLIKTSTKFDHAALDDLVDNIHQYDKIVNSEIKTTVESIPKKNLDKKAPTTIPAIEKPKMTLTKETPKQITKKLNLLPQTENQPLARVKPPESLTPYDLKDVTKNMAEGILDAVAGS